MPRYDKYDPYVGGFRAPLAAAVAAADAFKAFGVGLDSSGRVVLGAGQTGVIGVYIAHGPKNIGDIADVMTQGEIVEWTANGAEGGAAAAAGTAYKGVTATGAMIISTDAAAGVNVGFTVEATRLIVRTKGV